jgi:radical SAM protein with 4Fe4S-binding SPASM domain
LRKTEGAPEGTTIRDLAWIDEFYRGMRPHLFAREEDGVVILPPNQVYKANGSGIAILRHMERVGVIARLPGLADGERARQVNGFFADLRDFCSGDARGMDRRASVEMIPFSFSYTTLPILGEIAVMYRCTNSCLFCYASCGASGKACGAGHPSVGSGRPARFSEIPGTEQGMHRATGSVTAPGVLRGTGAGREMSLSEIRRIIDIFKNDAKIPFFSFTGGEPLLREDLERMIRHARRKGLRINLITNAVLADRPRARSLSSSGLRTAQVSVESPDEGTHDHLTDSPGSYRKTLTGIENLREAGISVQTNTTITALNADSAALMPGFLKGLGVERFAMNLYIPVGGPAAEGLFFPYSKVAPVIEAVRRAARELGMTFYWYSPVPHCIYNPIAKGLGNKSCAAMDGLLSVSPSGEVLPCSSYPKSMGNLLEESFRDIWFSAEARHFKNKEYAPAECAGCQSFRACQAACPLYWEHAGTAEIYNNAAGKAVRAGSRRVGRQGVKEA